MNMRRLIFFAFVIAVAGLFLIEDCHATEVPDSPSDVYIDRGNNNLIVRKPNDTAKPFIIKGVSWSPATRAPEKGPNPLALSETIDYGFFFDWTGRNPQGYEVLNYWMRNQAAQHYLTDIPLIQKMNANTVRVYSDFGDDPALANAVLDTFYRNNIMVIMTVAISKEDLEEAFYVYRDKDSPDNHFVPSGWMGDYGDLTFNDRAQNSSLGQNCIKINYTANRSQGQGWAGIYWQQPANNWGSAPNAGYNLSGARRITFWARGEKGGEVVEFKVGGITGPYPDSAAAAGKIKLSNEWQKYAIDLNRKNLSYIIGGFCFTVVPPAKIFYIDDIRYEGFDISGQISEKRYRALVNKYKNHPAILMWALGNEWNLNRLYDNGNLNLSLDDAADMINFAAREIRELDQHHPLCSILGDTFWPSNNSGCPPAWSVTDILQRCPAIDIWGLNLYRGESFGSLFKDWRSAWQAINQPSKPFFVSEFGIDSFHTQGYTAAGDNCLIKADNVNGYIDEQEQAYIDVNLWNEIKGHLSINSPNELCLGGLIHEFNDELWKAGSYHVGLGGLIDYLADSRKQQGEHSYETYDNEGFVLQGSSPDNVLNEEYFGLVKADRTPKLAYRLISEAFKPDLPDLAVTDIKFYQPRTEIETIPSPGRLVTCKALLKNQGRRPSGIFNVKWFLDLRQVGYGSHTSLAPGAVSEGNVRFDWIPALGTHTLRFSADVDNHVRESDESNNSISKSISMVNNAAYVAQNIPTTMTAGQAYMVQVQMRNTGTTVWDASNLYRLGSQNPRNNLIWSVPRVMLNNPVAPEGTATFNFIVLAPSTSGTYNFQWRMVQDSRERFWTMAQDDREYFGQVTANVAVRVQDRWAWLFERWPWLRRYFR